MIRITGGELRGRKIPVPKGRDVRPTTDKVRLALGNMLAGEFDGARVLDLFAGTGSLAFEAASRGASEVVLVEKNRKYASLIRLAAESLGLDGRVKVVNTDAFRTSNILKEKGEFDIIFMDPPYEMFFREKELKQIEGLVSELAAGSLTPGGILVIQAPEKAEVPHGPLILDRERTYGSTKVLVFIRGE